MNLRSTDHRAPTTGEQPGASLHKSDLTLLLYGRPTRCGHHVGPIIPVQAHAPIGQVALPAQSDPSLPIQTP
jgi:hypothetical protein